MLSHCAVPACEGAAGESAEGGCGGQLGCGAAPGRCHLLQESRPQGLGPARSACNILESSPLIWPGTHPPAVFISTHKPTVPACALFRNEQDPGFQQRLHFLQSFRATGLGRFIPCCLPCMPVVHCNRSLLELGSLLTPLCGKC